MEMNLRILALKQGYIDMDNKRIIDDYYKQNKNFRTKHSYYYKV